MSTDPYRALTAQSPRHGDDDSNFPSAGSSRSNTPGCCSTSSTYNYESCTSSTRPTSSHVSTQPTTSMSELSQYFNRHTIHPQRRSTPNPLDHAHPPLGLYRPHDPTDLAILSTTHAHRIARRKQSMRGLQCNPKQLHRVASLVEDLMTIENHQERITSQPSSSSTTSFREEINSNFPSRPPSLTAMSSPSPSLSPEAEDSSSSTSLTPDSSISSSSYSYFPLDDSAAVAASAAAANHHEKKVLKPIRMRKRPPPPTTGRRRGESFAGIRGGGGGR